MQIPEKLRAHVEQRLRTDLIAWLTTVRPDGAPDTVPVWFAWHDGVVVVYSEPGKRKLDNLEHNPHVSLALDDTGGGDDVVRFEATARVEPDHPPADHVPGYVGKYATHMRRLGYGDPVSFAASFSVPVVLSPHRFRQWA